MQGSCSVMLGCLTTTAGSSESVEYQSSSEVPKFHLLLLVARNSHRITDFQNIFLRKVTGHGRLKDLKCKNRTESVENFMLYSISKNILGQCLSQYLGVYRAFSVCALRFWNNLPLALRKLNSIVSFKRGLKT